MREHGTEDGGITFSMQSLMQGARVVGAVLGIIAIIIGLVYATRVFDLVLNTLQAPDAFAVHLDKWVEAVGGEQLDLTVAGETLHGSRVFAIVILGGGAIVLVWLSLGFIIVGAKTVSWTLSDREAIKKLLVHTFGPSRKPQPPRSEKKT
jgi:hypothetical protein